MRIRNIHETKTHLSKLIDQVQSGEEIIIGKAGKPVAKLVPFTAAPIQRKPGSHKGKISIADDFDSLPDDLMIYFKGEK